MKSKKETPEINKWNDLFRDHTENDEIEHETQMLAFTFLSFVEKFSDLKGLNRKELANKIRTSPSYITQLFRGDKLPNIEILIKMSKVLGFRYHISTSLDGEEMLIHNEEEFLKAIRLRSSDRGCWMFKVVAPKSQETDVYTTVSPNILNCDYEDKAIPA